MDGSARHWDDVYTRCSPHEVSWYEEQPSTSLRLIRRSGLPSTGLVDIGAGASALADALLSHGWDDITLLDVSEQALAVVRDRVADEQRRVSFVVADVLEWRPNRQFNTWHDRAVFHFLVDAEDRGRYVAIAATAVRTGGVLILGTFAVDGPTSCSGLPTARYDADGLTEVFADFFVRVEFEREEHRTPQGAVQPYTWVVLRRRDTPRGRT